MTKIHGDSRTVVKGISGSVKDVFRADKAVIQFGHLRQENQDLPAFDLKPTSDRISTEVLAFSALRCCTCSTSRLTIATAWWTLHTILAGNCHARAHFAFTCH